MRIHRLLCKPASWQHSINPNITTYQTTRSSRGLDRSRRGGSMIDAYVTSNCRGYVALYPSSACHKYLKTSRAVSKNNEMPTLSGAFTAEVPLKQRHSLGKAMGSSTKLTHAHTHMYVCTNRDSARCKRPEGKALTSSCMSRQLGNQ